MASALALETDSTITPRDADRSAEAFASVSTSTACCASEGAGKTSAAVTLMLAGTTDTSTDCAAVNLPSSPALKAASSKLSIEPATIICVVTTDW